MKPIHCGPFPCGCKLHFGDVKFPIQAPAVTNIQVMTLFLCDYHAELVCPEVKALARKMRMIVVGKTRKVGILADTPLNEKVGCLPTP